MRGAVAVVLALLAKGHQHTIHQTKISRLPDLALIPGLGLLSCGSGWGRLARSRGPTSRGAGIIGLPGGLGLLPSLLAPLDAVLIPGLIALVRPAPLSTTVPATILLKFLIVARGRKSLVLATSSTFLSNVPLVAFAQLDVGANFLT